MPTAKLSEPNMKNIMERNPTSDAETCLEDIAFMLRRWCPRRERTWGTLDGETDLQWISCTTKGRDFVLGPYRLVLGASDADGAYIKNDSMAIFTIRFRDSELQGTRPTWGTHKSIQ
ncbi:hypothetical protein Zmor_017331 [Zophobas morio]|uniref:Uncharacterized protein n=1 Tax=Zophobas morio TaxID=2755281 RepID=A0AA38I7U3_9CUCU|nr:hypothetical protein Zmor_016656 [Zophobas morio]KAJ3651281.1 hypothetical protein Zmor_017331 [Zophobas morio]